jgi:serine/threonine protein kinase
MKWKSVRIDLNYKIFFKIVDMGNACFADKHFTEGIQTREYRSPEVILGHPYFHNTDIWSLACTVFELMTNNFLFKPKKIEGISKDEDHLYKMLEVLGPMSKEFATGGTESSQYFNKKGRLIHGNPKEQLAISKLLTEDYGYDPAVAKETEEFLMPMLAYEPKNRISAKDCLSSAWLWK